MQKFYPSSKIIASCVFALFTASANAAALNLNAGGKLIGATGVKVGNNLHDVEFIRGTFPNIFGNSNNIVRQFTFTTADSATEAGYALLGQVFINTAAGNFDTDIALTLNCPNDGANCEIMTPYLRIPAGTNGNPLNRYNFNEVTNTPQVTAGTGTFGNRNITGVSNNTNYLFAVWSAGTPIAAVPEPETYAMFLAGLGLLGFAARRKQV